MQFTAFPNIILVLSFDIVFFPFFSFFVVTYHCLQYIFFPISGYSVFLEEPL